MSSEPLFEGTRELIAPVYTYEIEDLATNKIVAEYNFSGVSYNNIISGIGKFKGKTALTSEVMKQNPRKTLVPLFTALHVLRNNDPIWSGIIVDLDIDEISNTVSITAFTFEWALDNRNQMRDINVKNVDQLDIARMYVNSGGAADAFNIEVDTTTLSGFKRERNAYAYELNSIYDELSRLSNLINGFDFRIIPYRDTETSVIKRKLHFGYPTLTTNSEDNTSFLFESNRNARNVKISMSGEHSALRVYAIGEGEGEGQKVAIADDIDLINSGYPRYESSLSAKNVKVYDTLVSQARSELERVRVPITEIKMTARGSTDPYVGSYAPGDWIRLRIDNAWFPEGLDDVFRVTNIEVKLEDRGLETVDLTFTGHGVRDKMVIQDSTQEVYVPPKDTTNPTTGG